jgi:hypothetical protein
MVTDTIEIRGTLTVSDLIRFQYFHLLRLFWPLALLFVPILPLNVFLFLLGGSWTSVATNMLPFSLLLVFWFLLPPISARRQLATRRYLAEEISYSFDAQGVRLAAASFSSTLKWSIFRAIRETKSTFLLYQGTNMAHIVPKHFFPSERELVAWKTAVAAWIAPKPIHAPGFVGKLC